MKVEVGTFPICLAELQGPIPSWRTAQAESSLLDSDESE